MVRVGGELPIMRQLVSEIGPFRRDTKEWLLSFARWGLRKIIIDWVRLGGPIEPVPGSHLINKL